MVLHTLSLGSLSLFPWLEMSGKVEVPFGSKLFEVHPTNSQCVSLPMMSFEYINGLPTNPYVVYLGPRLKDDPHSCEGPIDLSF